MVKFVIYFIFLFLLSACGDTVYHSHLGFLYNHSVPTISADCLYGLMEQSEEFLLLDSRSQEEWQLSRLPQAQFAGFEEFKLTSLNTDKLHTPVIVYCTIGHRSELMAEQLQEAGFMQVSHLYGGIIEWKNNLYPLVNQEGLSTDTIHTYDAYWGTFLKKGIAVYE